MCRLRSRAPNPQTRSQRQPAAVVNRRKSVGVSASAAIMNRAGFCNPRRATVAPNTQQTNGRIALVTGGTDGLGRAAAVMLAEHGYRVFAGGLNEERIAALKQLAQERSLTITAME